MLLYLCVIAYLRLSFMCKLFNVSDLTEIENDTLLGRHFILLVKYTITKRPDELKK